MYFIVEEATKKRAKKSVTPRGWGLTHVRGSPKWGLNARPQVPLLTLPKLTRRSPWSPRGSRWSPRSPVVPRGPPWSPVVPSGPQGPGASRLINSLSERPQTQQQGRAGREFRPRNDQTPMTVGPYCKVKVRPVSGPLEVPFEGHRHRSVALRPYIDVLGPGKIGVKSRQKR